MVDQGVEGLRVGRITDLPEGADPDVDERLEAAFDALRAAGATIVDVQVPAFTYGLTAYYLIAPAEASSNLARYDGVRYGLRVEAPDTNAMYGVTRAAGFGDEVKRRIMLGTYALSAGYYDAYYGKALKVRRLIPDDFERAYQHADVLLTPTSPTVAFPFGAKVDNPLAMYLCDVYTIPANLTGHPGMSVPFGTGADGLPVGVQVLAGTLGEPQMFRAAAALERGACHEGAAMSERDGLPGDWQLVVGLEVHVELATVTKLFSASPNRFGDEPNTNIDPVTLGLPGALPVLNRQAVELAMRIGLALNCTIQPCAFHRKNYFYPDMPKAYQISQYDQPLNVDGHLELPDGTRIGIERAHLEEDTGKSTHFGGSGGRIHGSDYSLIDFNRAGVPLVEIVSRPDIRTVEQARQYVSELRGILLAVGASDAKMEEGSMRVDANVSVHKPGTPFGTRCEIKNVNSVRSLGRAIEYEARRQIDLLESGERVRQETRHWDEGDGRTHTLRTKEDADDYRYFLEPDLVPLAPSQQWIDDVRAALPMLPARAAGPACRGHRRSRPTARRRWWSSTAVKTTTCSPSAAAGGDAARALVHVKEAFADSPVGAGGRPRRADHVGGQRQADGDPGQGGRRRADRQRWRRRGADRGCQGLRGDGHRRARVTRRSGDRRERRGVGEVLRRRGQGDGRSRRSGHEAQPGQGRRQGSHRAAEPEEGLTPTGVPARCSPGDRWPARTSTRAGRRGRRRLRP